MTIAAFSLGDSSISEVQKESPKKLMPKRIYTPKPDRPLIPEPR